MDESGGCGQILIQCNTGVSCTVTEVSDDGEEVGTDEDEDEMADLAVDGGN